jgi:PPK2 family polyphosphate:nucleotide phosphotransferase
MAKDDKINTKQFLVKPGSKVKLKKFKTGYSGKVTRKKAVKMLEKSREQLALIQDMYYAHNRYSVLLIFQAMDAAGKDGAVKHIMSGFNPQGVRVHSFKSPSSTELDHDFLWRHMAALPQRGEIAIHNRSHYENVLVTRVHPEYLLKENLPGIESVAKIDAKFWEGRFKKIREFEAGLAHGGMIIIKFFLHVSRAEQKRRFLERIDDPAKNWKFSSSDASERRHWDDYQRAYEEAISETSTKRAPWYIIPADDKWFTRLAVATVIKKEFEKLKLSYPVVAPPERKEQLKARRELMREKVKG